MSGMLQICAGFIQLWYFEGRRITFIMICMVLLIVIDILWMSFSHIYQIQKKTGDKAAVTYDDIGAFDKALFLIQGASC